MKDENQFKATKKEQLDNIEKGQHVLLDAVTFNDIFTSEQIDILLKAYRKFEIRLEEYLGELKK